MTLRRDGARLMVELRGGMLAVPARVGMRLPHLTAFNISEIDREVRAVLTETSGGDV
jgi:hypothetical protein